MTKILPPRLPRVFYRKRLIQKLLKYQDKKLVLILGQAAQGKSTLAALYLKSIEAMSIWINLGEEDSDHVSLCRLMIRSIRSSLAHADSPPLQSSFTKGMIFRKQEMCFGEWAEEICTALDQNTYIILDGLERLQEGSSSLLFLQEFLENLPGHIHLIGLTRKMPQLKLQALKMRQEYAVIANAELAFTVKETEAFCRELRVLDVSKEEVKAIHRITEGWVGGLIIWSEVLERTSGSARELLLEDVSHQFENEVFHYFDEEIFSRLSALEQEFLLKASIFSQSEPSFLNEMAGVVNAEDILQGLALKNLFVRVTYDAKRKVRLFCYHPLFRKFLQAKRDATMSEDKRCTLYARAAGISERRGDYEAAVGYYLEAKAYEQAASAVTKIGTILLRQGRGEDLKLLLKELPGPLVEDNPWLLLYLAQTTEGNDLSGNAPIIEKAYCLFESAGDLQGQLLSMAELLYTCTNRGYDSTPISILLKKGEKLLSSPGSLSYPFETMKLLIQLGFALMLRGSNPRMGSNACHDAYIIARGSGDTPHSILALTNAVFGLGMLGEFERAEDLNREIGEIMDRGSCSEFMVLNLCASMNIFLGKGDLENAKKTVDAACREAQKHGLTFLYAVALMYDLMFRKYVGEFSETEEIARHLLALAASLNNRFLHGQVHMWLGMARYFKGDLDSALPCVDEAEEILSDEASRGETQLHLIKLIRGLIHVRHGIQDRTEPDLHAAMEYFHTISSKGLSMDANLVMALLKWQQNDRDETARYLNAGLSLAEAQGYDHSFTLTKRDLARACALAIEVNTEPGTKIFAASLLMEKLAAEAVTELEWLSSHGSAFSRRKVWEMRKAIHHSLAPRLDIITLGGFQVLRDGKPIEEKDWERIQPKNLLKAVIARGCRGVTKDMLMEDLWPEVDTEAQEGSFRVTLFRLRKILEPDMSKEFGSSYIHIKDNLVGICGRRCAVDVLSLMTLIRKGEEEQKKGSVDKAMAFFEEARSLYRGDFLPDDLYASWAETERALVNKQGIGLLLKMARLYEVSLDQDNAVSCYEQCLHVDPLVEEAYRGLMKVYLRKGMINQALMVYKECEKALQKGLDMGPEKLTEDLHREIAKASSMHKKH